MANGLRKFISHSHNRLRLNGPGQQNSLAHDLMGNPSSFRCMAPIPLGIVVIFMVKAGSLPCQKGHASCLKFQTCQWNLSLLLSFFYKKMSHMATETLIRAKYHVTLQASMGPAPNCGVHGLHEFYQAMNNLYHTTLSSQFL